MRRRRILGLFAVNPGRSSARKQGSHKRRHVHRGWRPGIGPGVVRRTLLPKSLRGRGRFRIL